MRQLWPRFKPYVHLVIIVATLVFLGITLKDHWQEVVAIRISQRGWVYLAIASGATLLSHVWAGWVWSWILKELHQPVSGAWAIRAYLITNLAKYLPSNLLHFYGRTLAATKAGVTLGAAVLSVLLEPLLMAAAALILILISSRQEGWELQILGLVVVLTAIHPRILNPIIQFLNRLKSRRQKPTQVEPVTLKIRYYPLWPLLGELGFLGLRGTGFILTVAALAPTAPQIIPVLMGAFSLAWLLGFITPGAAGGIGIFEVTVISLLNNASTIQADQSLSPGIIIGAVALYRLLGTLAEAIGAGLAWLYERLQKN
jgi:hypothetical protein